MLKHLLDAAGCTLADYPNGFTLSGHTYFSLSPARAGVDPVVLRDYLGDWLIRAWSEGGRMVWVPFQFAFSGDNLLLKVSCCTPLYTGDGQPLGGIAYANDRRILNRLRATELLK